MHECSPFISRQIFEMACFRCQVLSSFTCSLLEVFGTLMSEYAPHSEPVLSFEDSICAQLQEPPILMYLRGTHVSTCIQTPPCPPIHQRRLNTHPSQALEQCFVARLQLALILPTRRKGLKGQQLRILLTPFGPALDRSGPLIGPVHIAEQKGRPWAKGGLGRAQGKGAKRATRPTRRAFCCISLRSPTGESERKIQAVGR